MDFVCRFSLVLTLLASLTLLLRRSFMLSYAKDTTPQDIWDNFQCFAGVPGLLVRHEISQIRGKPQVTIVVQPPGRNVEVGIGGGRIDDFSAAAGGEREGFLGDV